MLGNLFDPPLRTSRINSLAQNDPPPVILNISSGAVAAGQWPGIVFKSATVLERKWLYKDGLNPIYEEAWDATSSAWVQTRFVYASRGNVPDFLIRDGVTYRVISDHLGSPRLVIDTASGMVAQALGLGQLNRGSIFCAIWTLPGHGNCLFDGSGGFN